MVDETKQKVVEELEMIPQDKLPELYDLIHHYRLGLEKSGSRRSQILQLAGSWSEMTEEEFTTFLEEIPERRSTAFAHRKI
jgi:hypothetical protein